MKIMFIKAKKKIEVDLTNINLNLIPDKIFLAYSIQYKELAEKLRKNLRERRKKIVGFKQVLGCSILKSKSPVLLVGSGKFHAIQLALQGNIVYILEGNNIKKLEEREIGEIKNRRKAALSKFLAAEKVGILVSCKPGQEKFKEAEKLKKKLEKQGKKVKIFLADNINIGELENYDIDSWLNTACPALSCDNRIINVGELKLWL